MDTKAYWESRLANEYSLLGVGDITLGLDYNRWLYRVRGDVFHRIARWRWPSNPPDRVIDIGSGTGFYLDRWIERSIPELVGSDITYTAVENLQHRLPDIEIRQLDIGARPAEIPQSSFDAVSAFDVLFHIVDDALYRQALEHIAALLTPGGTFLYSDNLVPDDQRIGHQTSRTRDYVYEALAEAGLTVVRKFPMFVLMNDPVGTRSRIAHRLFAKLTGFVRRGEHFGNLAGAALYAPERLLTKLLRRGPSTEILVCEKAGG